METNKTIVLIDGFNLYHSLKEWHPRHHRWIHFGRLADELLGKNFIVEKIIYFTAFSVNEVKKSRHQLLIQANRTDERFSYIKGKFKKSTTRCRAKCKELFEVYNEKETDVNIAIHLIETAYEKKYSKCLVISGDTDYIPAIKLAQKINPSLDIGVGFPLKRENKELKDMAKFTRHINENLVKHCLLEETLTLKSGNTISCPPEWLNKTKSNPLYLGLEEK